MSKNIKDYFKHSYPGLDLLQNPKKSKSNKWFGSTTVNTDKKDLHSQLNSLSNLNKISEKEILLNNYKQQILDSFPNLTIPIKPYQRSNPILVLLELGYYQYINNINNPVTELGSDQNTVLTPANNNNIEYNTTSYGVPIIIKQLVDEMINKIVHP